MYPAVVVPGIGANEAKANMAGVDHVYLEAADPLVNKRG
jgi:hypothetical protein